MNADYDQLESFTWDHQYFHSLTVAGKLAFIYILDLLLKHRDYVSLATMSYATGLTEDVCETYVRQFSVDRELPRMKVLEEQVG